MRQLFQRAMQRRAMQLVRFIQSLNRGSAAPALLAAQGSGVGNERGQVAKSAWSAYSRLAISLCICRCSFVASMAYSLATPADARALHPPSQHPAESWQPLPLLP